MSRKIVPVVLSGGSGSRLWPLSRSHYPKQFLSLIGDKSLLVQALERIAPHYGYELPIVIANEDHRFIINKQTEEAGLSVEDILLEPVGRNTAPAVLVAALQAAERNPDALLLFLASDHVIIDTPGFHNAVQKASVAAEQGNLCCFGMTPTAPETGYGYIAQGAAINGTDSCYKVDSFREKPDAETAARYLASGDYLWNSGMFLFRVDVILSEFERLQPDMLEGAKAALKGASRDLNFLRLESKAFSGLDNISVDYAIMEKTQLATVVPASFGWSDVGSFETLWGIQPKDADNNLFIGDIIAADTKDSFVYSDSQLVATLGIKDMIVMATNDAVMVADRARSQDIKILVEKLKADKRIEADFQATVYRPWGNYRTLAVGPRFQVKEIEVYPGKRLSLQRHHHRAEHWVIVGGSALVTRDGETHLLTENQSIYLPLGAVHRLENPGKIPTRLVEVQSGSYLGEDDIVRLEDDYNRQLN